VKKKLTVAQKKRVQAAKAGVEKFFSEQIYPRLASAKNKRAIMNFLSMSSGLSPGASVSSLKKEIMKSAIARAVNPPPPEYIYRHGHRYVLDRPRSNSQAARSNEDAQAMRDYQTREATKEFINSFPRDTTWDNDRR
jgi:hypothetical protein